MKRAASTGSPPRRGRGGVRQRLAASRALEEVHGKSALASLLLFMFAWGDISPQLAQKIADAAYSDAEELAAGRSTLQDLKKVADIGTKGAHPNKCYADLVRTCPFKLVIPEPISCKLLFKEPLKWLTQSMLLPHQLFSSIYHDFRATWTKTILPSTDRLKKFWATNRDHPAFTASRVGRVPEFDSTVIPISLHGDDVPITGLGKSWAAGMTMFSWSSMVGLGTTREMMYLIYGIFEKLREVDADQARDTYGQFFKMLSWSFRWLFLGLWPDCDWTGKKSLGLFLEKSLWFFEKKMWLSNFCRPTYVIIFCSGVSILLLCFP